jgi:hypothetical protein
VCDHISVTSCKTEIKTVSSLNSLIFLAAIGIFFFFNWNFEEKKKPIWIANLAFSLASDDKVKIPCFVQNTSHIKQSLTNNEIIMKMD